MAVSLRGDHDGRSYARESKFKLTFEFTHPEEGSPCKHYQMLSSASSFEFIGRLADAMALILTGFTV